ncbi:MAG: hypothetical protein GXY41_06355 [Phycisphaerae bacterium]|nr:hypothetical protein [Phycisphaerae bacterium]
MIKNAKKLEAFYNALDAQEHLSVKDAMAIFDLLHAEAVAVGAIHSGNMLEGIEVDIRIADAINRVGQ